MEYLDINSGLGLFFIVLGFFCWLAIKIVPQQQAWIVERLGKYNKNTSAWINFYFAIY